MPFDNRTQVRAGRIFQRNDLIRELQHPALKMGLDRQGSKFTPKQNPRALQPYSGMNGLRLLFPKFLSNPTGFSASELPRSLSGAAPRDRDPHGTIMAKPQNIASGASMAKEVERHFI